MVSPPTSLSDPDVAGFVFPAFQAGISCMVEALRRPSLAVSNTDPSSSSASAQKGTTTSSAYESTAQSIKSIFNKAKGAEEPKSPKGPSAKPEQKELPATLLPFQTVYEAADEVLRHILNIITTYLKDCPAGIYSLSMVDIICSENNKINLNHTIKYIRSLFSAELQHVTSKVVTKYIFSTINPFSIDCFAKRNF